MLVAGCGPSLDPPTHGSEGTAGTSAGEPTTDLGQSSGEPPPSTTGSSTTGSEGVDATGSTAAVVECPPRELPEHDVYAWSLVDGRIEYPAPAQADCMLDDIAVAPGTSTDVSLSCTFADGTSGVMTLRFELELDFTSALLTTGVPLTWARVTETCCLDAEQHAMGLHDADGTLLLGIFQGWDPATSDGVATVLAPLGMALVEEACPPCEGASCLQRMAIDASVGGSAAVRIYDGTSDLVDAEPSFLVYVPEAAATGVIFDGPQVNATVVVIRVAA